LFIRVLLLQIGYVTGQDVSDEETVSFFSTKNVDLQNVYCNDTHNAITAMIYTVYIEILVVQELQ